jgi:uncharacterized membrane protein HdeD (DUF308 family)
MAKLTGQIWWTFAWRGAVALLFGVLALLWPGITLLWLVALFAAYALISGIVSVVGGVVHRKSDERWWLALILGLVSVGAGIIALVHPDLTALVLVLLMGANAIATGILDIVMAVRLRKALRNDWVLVLAGLVSITFGVLVFLFPAAGALAMVWLISVYAITAGVLLLIAAVRSRNAGRAAYRGMPDQGIPA